MAALKTWKVHEPVVAVDSVGMGYYFALHLRDAGFKVKQVNVGEPSTDPERFANLRAEMHWALRERFETGDINGLTDEDTIGQLTSITYRHNARGQVVVTAKEKMAADGIASPDRAESLMLAFLADKADENEFALV